MVNFNRSLVGLSGRHVAIAVIVVMFITYLWIGIIPLNDGAAWDGNSYIAYVKSVASGVPIVGDPYRTIRMSGFLQLMPFAWRGEGKTTLIFIQLLFNIGLMAVGVGSLFSCLRTMGVKPHKAVLAVIPLAFSWAGLVIPVYYPVLSDNTAIPFCCIALWCWVNQKVVFLHIICAWFVWLFPGLFLVPLGLIAFPYGADHKGRNIAISSRVKIPIFALFLTVGLLAYHYFMRNITIERISTHVISGGETAIVKLIPISILVQSLIIAVLAWIAATLLCRPQLYKAVSIRNFLLGAGTVGASFILMRAFVDFSTGFQGPPLLDNLMMQSAGAPLKPWISHFLYFGFFILLVAIRCIKWSVNSDHHIPMGLLVTFLVFSPFLSFGSESRQWIGVLPVAIVIYALMNIKWQQQVFVAAVSIISLFTLYNLRPTTLTAVQYALGLQSPEWQYYFGRQGPWMSIESYQIGLMALTAISIIYVCLGAFKIKTVIAPAH